MTYMFGPHWGHHQADIQNILRKCTHYTWKRDLTSYRLR